MPTIDEVFTISAKNHGKQLRQHPHLFRHYARSAMKKYRGKCTRDEVEVALKQWWKAVFTDKGMDYGADATLPLLADELAELRGAKQGRNTSRARNSEWLRALDSGVRELGGNPTDEELLDWIFKTYDGEYPAYFLGKPEVKVTWRKNKRAHSRFAQDASKARTGR